jgi:pimeloyl-ACP methyl ester carboxylesterase
VPLVEVNAARVHVTDTGAPPGHPDAPVVVLGHSLLFSTSMWRHQIEALRASYRCVAIDWRGQGETPPTDHGYDMDALYADAVGVIEGLGVGPVHYAGLSMGGFVGLRLAARRPDLIRTLTLIDTSAGPEDPEKVSRYRLLATIYGLVGLRPLRSQVAPIMFSRAFLATGSGREVQARWLAELGRQTRRGTKGAIRGVTDRVPVRDELGTIAAPTLVVHGTGDAAIPVAEAEAMAAAIPGARLELLSDVGHVSALEAPDAVTEMLVTFLGAG